MDVYVEAYLMHEGSLLHSVLDPIDHRKIIVGYLVVLNDEIDERDISSLVNQTLVNLSETHV